MAGMGYLAYLCQYKIPATKYKKYYISSCSAEISAYMPVFLWFCWLYMDHNIYNRVFLPVMLIQCFYCLNIPYRQFYRFWACAFYCNALLKYQLILAIWSQTFSASILYWPFIVMLWECFYFFFPRSNPYNKLICQIFLETGFYLL